MAGSFFHGRLPEQIAELKGALETQKAEFKLQILELSNLFEAKLADAQNRHDQDIEELESALLDRIEQGEKTSRASSLSTDGKKPEDTIGLPRYEKWSQRKARHKGMTRSAGFAQKTLQRAQRGTGIVVETKE